MCRNKDERNERCDCDTSEARRLRRHTRDALDRHAQSAYTPIVPNFLAAPVIEESFTVEKVKEEINSIRSSIKELLEQGHDDEMISIFVDKKINNIGAGIEYLSENVYGAPTDQELREAHESFRIPFLDHEAAALASGMTEEEAEEVASDKIDTDYKQAISQLIEKRNNAFKNALGDVGVEFANPETLKYSRKSDKEAVKILQRSLSFYPQSWVDDSNSLSDFPLEVKQIGEYERAGYEARRQKFGIFKRTSIIYVNQANDDYAGGLGTGMHEFAHRMEHSVPGIIEMERTFVLRRTGHYADGTSYAQPEKPSPILEEMGDEADAEPEIGFKDNFPTHYMGKFYSNGAWEVLAMGMETLFTGTNGGFAGIQKYKEDSDYKKFILGILASSAAK